MQKNIFFVLGPFLWTDPFYEKQKDLYSLKKNNPEEYTFYSNLKKVKTTPVEILLPLVFNLVNCEFMNIDTKPHTIKETVKESAFELKKMNISSEDIELTNERYNLENLKLSIVWKDEYLISFSPKLLKMAMFVFVKTPIMLHNWDKLFILQH